MIIDKNKEYIDVTEHLASCAEQGGPKNKTPAWYEYANAGHCPRCKVKAQFKAVDDNNQE